MGSNPAKGGAKMTLSPARLRSNRKVTALPDSCCTTVGPTTASANGVGHLPAIEMSMMASRMPTTARMPISTSHAQGRRRSSLMRWAWRRKPHQDREVERSHHHQRDEGDQQQDVDRRHVWQRPRAEAEQVAEDAGRDRAQAVEAREVPEDERRQQSFRHEQRPRAAIAAALGADGLHDIADKRRARDG